jgi:hypothetical protein
MKYVGNLIAVCALTGAASGQTVLMDQIGAMDGASVDANTSGSQYFEAAYSTYSLAVLDNFTLTNANNIGLVEAVVNGWNGFTDPSTITSYQANIYTSPTAASLELVGDVASSTVDAADATIVADWQGSGYLVSFQTSMYVDAGDYWVSVIPRNDYDPNGQTGIDGSLIGDGTYGWQANPGGAFEMPNNMQEMAGEAAFRLFDDVVPDPCNSPLPTECTADVDGDLQVAVGDVLLIIGNWGVCGDGTFRPTGDVAPMPNGDCCVDVSDVLAVIGAWGEDCLPRGACCSDSGDCSDAQLQSDCENSGGLYLGDDSECADGGCVSGACCIDESTCQDDTVMWVCDAIGGIFRGSGSTCSTVSCTSGCNATGCQSPDLDGHGSSGTIGATSDTNPGAGFRVADTFRPTASGAITEVCWWGLYIDFGTSTDCGASGPGTGDNFTITYYLDDGDSTVPGTMFAGPFMVSSSVAPTGDVIPSGIGDIVQYQYSAYHPPVKVQADACYWISIVNETTADCYWLWQTAPEGDGRSAQDNAGWATADYDLGFCVNIDITSDGCGAFVGPCCLSDLSCQIMSASSCEVVAGTYGGDNLTCGDVNNCQPIAGACCFDITTCLDNYFDADCLAFGATFMGEGTVCAEVNCDIQPPGCPDGVIFGQDVAGVDDAWTAGTSTDDPGYPVYYERAESVYVDSMSAVTVYGLQLYFSGAWAGCDTDFDFNIRSYADGSGLPGTLNAEALDVPATKTDTGEIYAGVYPLMKWDMDFAATNVDWISLQSASAGLDCWFLWMSSGAGDGSSAIDSGTGFAVEAFDLNICIE